MAQFDLHEIAFPSLDDEQIAKLGSCTATSVTKYAAGDVLVQVGDRDFKFFVVRSGEIEILDQTGETPTTIAVHGRGEFTGDVSHLTGTPAIFTAVALSDCEVYAISSALLKEVINQCPDLGDIILRAFMARRQLVRESGTFTGVRVIGSRYSPDTFRIREFLAKNLVLFTWTDIEANPDVDTLLKHFGVTEAETPIVVCPKHVLRNPSNRELAEGAGIRKVLERTVYDLAVVGAGPAGLAAAVYGASEGLNTVVLERTAAGGQAGSSMRIENYLGFPAGLTGSELTEKAVIQASKFGAVLSVGTPVTGVTFNGGYSEIGLDDGQSIVAKSLLVATGADYRRLEVDGCERFEGCGVYYSATPNEAKQCKGADVAVVGGGNSAGQAAVYLAGQARSGVPPDPRRRSVQADVVISCASDRAHAQYRDPARHHRRAHARRRAADDHRGGQPQDRRQTRLEHRRALQLHRRLATDRMASQRHRDRRSRLRPDRVSGGEVVGWGDAARAVPPRDQPARRIRRG